MSQHDMRSGFGLGTVIAIIATGALLASCTTPEQQPLSPVADPNAPMRVSTARVTTAPPDPVGQLFNDGPRQITTYSVNTDPLSVLFRDPAFIIKLSPTTEAEPVQLATLPADAQSTASPSRAKDSAEPPIFVVRAAPAQSVESPGQRATETRVSETSNDRDMPEPLAPRPALQPDTREATTESTADTTRVTTTTPQTVSGPAPTSNALAGATPPLATAATAPAAPSLPAKPPTQGGVENNDPVVLDGLKQKTAGWPIATKPSNTFGAKGPDGSAWRGLVYKSPANTPVKAIDPGTVIFAQPLRGYGNVIIIDHGKNYTSIYGYNEALTKKVGDTVRKGETVALVGDTGPLADEALYFEIRKGSVPIDPSIYLATNP